MVFQSGIEEKRARILLKEYTTLYIPHHAVYHNENATTKLQIVYDASAKASGPSFFMWAHRSVRESLKSCSDFAFIKLPTLRKLS